MQSTTNGGKALDRAFSFLLWGNQTESAAEDDKESDKETKGRNSFFGKKKKDNKLEQQIEDLTDRLKRNMAEFDNFRKRTEKKNPACM